MKNNKEATLKEWGELLDKMGLNDVSTTKINIARILDSDASRLINEEMSKERYNQIIDEVYRNYKRNTHEKNEKNCNYGEYSKWGDNPLIAGVQHLTKSSFIQMCKIVHEFSEKWGLKIEERELSLEERCELGYKYVDPFEWDMLMGGGQEGDEGNCNDYNIPTKIITLTYNNETIEVYE